MATANSSARSHVSIAYPAHVSILPLLTNPLRIADHRRGFMPRRQRPGDVKPPPDAPAGSSDINNTKSIVILFIVSILLLCFIYFLHQAGIAVPPFRHEAL